MPDSDNNIAVLQAEHIIRCINSLDCSRDEKLKLLNSIISAVKTEDIKQLDKAI